MLKIKGSQEDLIILSSSLSKLLKRKFGKGPETCYASLKEGMISVHIKNFITPAEEVLIENKEINLAYNFRSAIMKAIFQEFKREITNILEVECEEIFHDWNYSINTGMILIILEESIGELSNRPDIVDSEKLLEVAKGVGQKIHKVPTGYSFFKLNQNSYAISYNGTMTQIEYILYKKGKLELLRQRSEEIKKEYTNSLILFERTFGRKIKELFFIWDYENDTSYIIFNF